VRIDLNSDLGESFGPWTMGQDEALMPSITSANVACGFHAGDPSVMRRTVALAGRHGDSEAVLLLNAGDQPMRFMVPASAIGPWQVIVNTACGRGEGTLLPPDGFELEAYAVALLMPAGAEGDR